MTAKVRLQVLREAPRRYECKIDVPQEFHGALLDHLCRDQRIDVDGVTSNTTARATLTQKQIRELKRLLRVWEAR